MQNKNSQSSSVRLTVTQLFAKYDVHKTGELGRN